MAFFETPALLRAQGGQHQPCPTMPPFHVYTPFPTSDPRSYPIHEVFQVWVPWPYFGVGPESFRWSGFFHCLRLYIPFPDFFWDRTSHFFFSHSFWHRTKFSASPGRRDPEYRSFKLIFLPDLRSDYQAPWAVLPPRQTLGAQSTLGTIRPSSAPPSACLRIPAGHWRSCTRSSNVLWQQATLVVLDKLIQVASALSTSSKVKRSRWIFFKFRSVY